MLNISEIKVSGKIDADRYHSFHVMTMMRSRQKFALVLIAAFVLIVLFMFLPWTQNVRAKGEVTTLRPEDRPQTIHTTIAGRVERWHVREGQLVKKGDTIVTLSEIKTEYFDPELLGRQDLQVRAKESAISAYGSKMQALDQQIAALRENLRLKSEQAQNKIKQGRLKVQSDSMELVAAQKDFQVARDQLARAQEMFQKGVISLVEFERRQLKEQETASKRLAVENKLLGSRNELLNALIELNNLRNEYGEKIAKSQSDRYSTQSDLYDAQGGMAKLESQYASYSVRSGFYAVLAPQDCYVVQALTPGIGETVKEGEAVVSVMPAHAQLAVEIFVNPMDVPLLDTGRIVRIIFDGWPAFVFSGWPGMSTGTYGGRIYAVDRVSIKDNKYRVLIAPDAGDRPWPTLLRAGSGAQGMVLLQNVPVWYEIWRQLNGFPPEFYNNPTADDEKPKDKAPVRSLK
jgi:adhesin transport system membrane fusion protein